VRLSQAVWLMVALSAALMSAGCSSGSPISSYLGVPTNVTTQYYVSVTDHFLVGFPVLKTSSGNSPIDTGSSTATDGTRGNGYAVGVHGAARPTNHDYHPVSGPHLSIWPLTARDEAPDLA
jgi:hypothetical protein